MRLTQYKKKQLSCIGIVLYNAVQAIHLVSKLWQHSVEVSLLSEVNIVTRSQPILILSPLAIVALLSFVFSPDTCSIYNNCNGGGFTNLKCVQMFLPLSCSSHNICI